MTQPIFPCRLYLVLEKEIEEVGKNILCWQTDFLIKGK
jgi:hypothetical protein